MELMIIMIIVAILSMGGISSWQKGYNHQKLWQTAQQLSHFLIMIRNQSWWNNRNYLLILQSNDDGWCISAQHQDKYCAKENPLQFLPRYKEVKVVEITRGLGFYGIHNTAWPGHIILESKGEQWKVILSVWGRIRLCPLSRERVC